MDPAPDQSELSAAIASDKIVETKSEAALVGGNLWHTIWIMSWPLLLLMISNAIVGVVDVQVAQSFGASAQAAVGLADQIVFLFIAAVLAASIGTNALVSRALGAGELDKAIHVQGQALLFALLMGIVTTICSLLFTRNLLQFFSPDPTVSALATPYLAIYALYFLPFCFLCIVNAGFRAAGDARTPLLVVLSMTIVNVVGDYWFVYGPMNYLGIKGLAIAGFIASIVGALVAWYRLNKSLLKHSIKKLLPADYEILGKLVKISTPAALQRLTYNLSSFVLFFTLKHCINPTAALAAWTIGMRVEAFLFMPMFALGQAVSSIVGQNLGARESDRAYRAGWNVAWLGFVSMLICGTVLFITAPSLAAIMTNDHFSQEYTISYLRILAIAQPFQSFAMIFNGALQGAGDTRMPMWITLFTHWVIRQPLAWLLAITCHFGAAGVWTAMSLSAASSGLLNLWRFQSRAWEKLKL
jgi:putative MATE family efflux protein